MIVKSFDEISSGRYHYTEPDNGNEMFVNPAIGFVGQKGDTDPQAFILEQGRGLYTGPHFHTIDQFQVFVRGGCQLGRRDMKAPSAHWTDAYTTYGPIVPGDDDVAFFTLRTDGSDVQHYMPGAKAEKVHRSGRNLIALTGEEPLLDEEIGDGDSKIEATLGPFEDGLAAFLCKAGAGGTVTSPDSGLSKGQYWLVLEGSVVVDGTDFPVGSLGLRRPGDALLTASAGAEGALVWFAQFPRPVTAAT